MLLVAAQSDFDCKSGRYPAGEGALEVAREKIQEINDGTGRSKFCPRQYVRRLMEIIVSNPPSSQKSSDARPEVKDHGKACARWW